MEKCTFEVDAYAARCHDDTSMKTMQNTRRQSLPGDGTSGSSEPAVETEQFCNLRIRASLHQRLKVKAAQIGVTMRDLVEPEIERITA